VKAFKYKKSLKNDLRNNCKCLTGEFLLQVGEQEHYIKSQSLYNFINTIIENGLSIQLIIENSFYGIVKKFDILDYLTLYKDLENNKNDDDYDDVVLFHIYIYTKFAKICENTIRQTILLLFSKM
jgi:hypothetical protein